VHRYIEYTTSSGLLLNPQAGSYDIVTHSSRTYSGEDFIGTQALGRLERHLSLSRNLAKYNSERHVQPCVFLSLRATVP
jgi:hypothetical protein